ECAAPASYPAFNQKSEIINQQFTCALPSPRRSRCPHLLSGAKLRNALQTSRTPDLLKRAYQNDSRRSRCPHLLSGAKLRNASNLYRPSGIARRLGRDSAANARRVTALLPTTADR